MLSPTLQSYVDAVRDAVVARGETPGTDELRTLTARLGVIARELADAEEPANSALSRGELALRSGRPDVAMREFATAYALRPWDPTTTAGLSRALLERARETRSVEDARRAKLWATRTLEAEPANPTAKSAQNELVELERVLTGPVGITTTSTSGGGGKVALLVGIAAVFVIALGAGAFFALSNEAEKATTDGSESAGSTTATPVAAVPTGGPAAVVATTTPTTAVSTTPGTVAATTAPTVAPGTEIAVPISLVMPPQRGLDAVSLDSVSSELRVYEGQDFYVLSAVVLNGSGQELRAASALVQLFDSAGTAVGSQRLELVATHQATLLPSDRQGVGATIPAPDNVRRAVIQVETVDAGPAPRESQPTLREATWTFVPPTGMMAGIYERSRQYTPGMGNTNGYARVDMLARNSGAAPIGWMKLSVTFTDARGAVVGTVDAIPVSTSVPPLAPGETRPFRVLTSVPSTWRDYTVRVIEAR